MKKLFITIMIVVPLMGSRAIAKLMNENTSKQMKAMAQMKGPQTSDQVTQNELALMGAHRTTVGRRNLEIKIPLSGHFVSSSVVAFQIYESDLRYIKPGLSFTGVSSVYPDQVVSGSISRVDPIVDPTSRTVRVIGKVKHEPKGILPETGFRGDVKFTLQNRVAIPEDSVLHTGDGDLVYLFTNGNELIPHKVALGLKSDNYYDVLKGLAPGDAISSGPNFLIDSESKIRAISQAEIENSGKQKKTSKPSCPNGQHWDFSMSMCMPGKG